MREAVRKFTAVVGGKEKVFRPGDPITENEAKELGLTGKPELAKRQSKKDEE